MKNFTRTLLVALVMLIMPSIHFAQTIPTTTQPTVEFDITDIANFDERVFFLHNLMNDSRFDVITSERDGLFIVSANEAFEGLNLQESFADFREQNANAFARMDKVQAAETACEYKGAMPNDFVNSLIMDVYERSRDNATCANADPFCTDNGMYQFPASTNAPSGEAGPDYDCLYTQPNPAWYYMQIDNPGNIDIYMYSTPSVDIDFCCWGPFATITNPSPCGSLTSDKVVSCSYSASPTEHCLIPATAQTGDYFILVITNYSNQTCNINFSKQSGTGTTNCGILPPLVDNSGPYCVGETINLTANGQAGASYSWSGPGGFSSTQQNPTRPNCTLNMAGTYTCTIAVGSATNSATTEVVIYPMPTANFTFTTVCAGSPTQFTSTSTTNPAGQTIQNYQWNFGDGQTGSGANPSHTYNAPGSYPVTLTVSCGGHCTSTKTQNVTVNALPTANFTYTTVCAGNPTQFTSTSQGQIQSYNWNFGDGQTGSGANPSHTYNAPGTYPVTLTVQGAGGCSDQIVQQVTVNAQPTANFTFNTVCRGNPTQFTSTATAPQGTQIQTYNWNFGDGQTGTGQTVTHTYAQPGEYTVTHTVGTSHGACTDQKVQLVPVYAQPSPTITSNPPVVGYGGTATLTANAGAQGSFNFHWEPANMVVNPNNQTTQTVPLYADQVFTVTVTNPQGGCEAETQVTVPMDGSGMSATATADAYELCEGESTTLHVMPLNGSGNYTYTWTPANSLNNANTQNPVATPPVGTTTYSCHVSDGVTNIDVSVNILVHPNELEEIEHTICDNDTYDFYGQQVSEPNIYEYQTQTEFGCQKIIRLNLSNWPTYETPISDRFCDGDTYQFYGQNITDAGVYYHTLESSHGCDSVLRLNLTKDPVYEFEIHESTCEGGPGYYFDGDYLQPSPTPYTYVYETARGCDSIIILHVDESEYNSKNYNVSVCATEYTWASNGQTYYETGVYYDTLQYPNTCDSTLVLNLELRPSYDIDEVATSCDTYRWKNDNYNVDMTFEESTTYTHHYTNQYGCPSEVTLYLTINDHDETILPVAERCDEYFWDPEGHEIIYTDHEDPVYTMSGTYHRTYKNIADCDSLVTMPVQFQYTPDPTPIYPIDLQNEAPHWVVTATEFQIYTYDFTFWDNNPNCRWDSISWEFETPGVNWFLEIDSTSQPVGKNCRMYVLNYLTDTVWLKATAYNRCKPDGVSRHYWFVCSFYGVEDNPTVSLDDFTVVPNPNNGQMTFNFEHLTGKVDIKVYDMKGNLIDKLETFNGVGPNSMQYDMKRKAEGIYFFVATAKEGTVARKVVITR